MQILIRYHLIMTIKFIITVHNLFYLIFINKIIFCTYLYKFNKTIFFYLIKFVRWNSSLLIIIHILTLDDI